MTDRDDAILKNFESISYSDDTLSVEGAKWLCQKCRELDAENRGKYRRISQAMRAYDELTKKI